MKTLKTRKVGGQRDLSSDLVRIAVAPLESGFFSFNGPWSWQYSISLET